MTAASRRVLVTGASGFLGSAVVRAVVSGGDEVVPACRPGSDPWRLARAGRTAAIELDITDSAACERVLSASRISHVVHCAAYGVSWGERDYARAFATNVLGAVAMVEASARSGVERFIHVGSCFEYQSRGTPIGEDAPLDPVGPYAATKAAASLLVLERARALGLPVVVARPFGLWGPLEAPDRVVPQILSAARTGKPLDLTRCEIVRDYLYVDDAAQALWRLLSVSLPTPREVVNVGSGVGVVLREFARAVGAAAGARSELLCFGARAERGNEAASLVADVTKLRAWIGAPDVTSLADGVARCCEALGARERAECGAP